MYVDARVCVCVLLNINTNFHTYEVLLIFFISFSSREESTENEKFNRAWKRCCGVGWGGLSREIHNCRFHAFTKNETLRRIRLNNLKLKKSMEQIICLKKDCSGPFSPICVEKLKWIDTKCVLNLALKYFHMFSFPQTEGVTSQTNFNCLLPACLLTNVCLVPLAVYRGSLEEWDGLFVTGS